MEWSQNSWKSSQIISSSRLTNNKNWYHQALITYLRTDTPKTVKASIK